MLGDEEILELLRISTKLLLYYESVLARENGIDRPYTLSPIELEDALARADELLLKDGRPSIRTYGDFAFIDSRLASTLLAQALDVVCVHYGAEATLDGHIAELLNPNPAKE